MARHGADGMKTSIMAVGERVAAPFESVLYGKIALPSQVEGITSRVQEMITTLDAWQQQERLRQIFLVYNTLDSGGTTPLTIQLLPLDRVWLEQQGETSWPNRTIPQFPVPQSELFSALVRQYLFLSL